MRAAPGHDNAVHRNSDRHEVSREPHWTVTAPCHCDHSCCEVLQLPPEPSNQSLPQLAKSVRHMRTLSLGRSWLRAAPPGLPVPDGGSGAGGDPSSAACRGAGADGPARLQHPLPLPRGQSRRAPPLPHGDACPSACECQGPGGGLLRLSLGGSARSGMIRRGSAPASPLRERLHRER